MPAEPEEPEEPEALAEPAWEPAPAAVWEPETVQPEAPPAPEELWPAPAADPEEQHWAPEQQWAPVEETAPAPAPRRSIGALDVLVTLLGAAAAFGIGMVVFADDPDIQRWFSISCVNSCELRGHDLLVAAISQSSFAVAVLAACISRVPGTAVLVFLVGLVPPYLQDQLTADDDWPLVVALLGFLLVDLVLHLVGRSFRTALVAGLIGAIAVGGYRGIWFQSVDLLRPMLDHPVELLYFLIVPSVLALVAGVLGGLVAGARNRRTG